MVSRGVSCAICDYIHDPTSQSGDRWRLTSRVCYTRQSERRRESAADEQNTLVLEDEARAVG